MKVQWKVYRKMVQYETENVMKGSEIQVIKILKISCYWKELDCVVSAKSFDIGFYCPTKVNFNNVSVLITFRLQTLS